MRLILIAWIGWLLVACEKGAPAPKADAAVCTTVGQSCEFAPGKLGTCVHRDDCTAEPCMVCQSQH